MHQCKSSFIVFFSKSIHNLQSLPANIPVHKYPVPHIVYSPAAKAAMPFEDNVLPAKTLTHALRRLYILLYYGFPPVQTHTQDCTEVIQVHMTIFTSSTHSFEKSKAVTFLPCLCKYAALCPEPQPTSHILSLSCEIFSNSSVQQNT